MAKRGVEVILRWKGEIVAWEHAAAPSLVLLSGILPIPAELPEDGSWVELEDGDLAIRARQAALARYAHRPPPLDRGLAWSMTAAMGLGIAFLLAVGFVPPTGATVAVDALTSAHPLMAYLHAPLADEPVPRDPRPIHGSGPITDGPGRPMAEAAGVSGATDGPRTRRGQIRIRGDQEVVRRIPRAMPDPTESGILGILATLDDPSRAGALAGDASVTGWTRDEAYGRPLAELAGLGHGADGFDMVGTGRGGCRPGEEGCGEGTVGSGPGLGIGGTGWGATCGVDTCEMGSFGRGVSGGLINLRGREDVGRRRRSRLASVPDAIRHVTVQREDGLTREEVRRALRRHRDALRHCYERAAAAAGGESGAVEIGLAIAPDGRVLSSEVLGDTLGDGSVAECIAAVASRTRFPEAAVATVASVPFGLDAFGGR